MKIPGVNVRKHGLVVTMAEKKCDYIKKCRWVDQSLKDISAHMFHKEIFRLTKNAPFK